MLPPVYRTAPRASLAPLPEEPPPAPRANRVVRGLKVLAFGTLSSALAGPLCAVLGVIVSALVLKSSDPVDHPLIDPNFCGDPYDWKISIEGFKWGRRILAAESFRPLIKREYMPGPDAQTDEEIKQYIRQWSKTDYHPVGSCKMGHDEMAVVDTQLRVHGLEGLRVIDASIMPAAASTPETFAASSTSVSSSGPAVPSISTSLSPATVRSVSRKEATTDSFTFAIPTQAATPSATPNMVTSVRTGCARRCGTDSVASRRSVSIAPPRR